MGDFDVVGCMNLANSCNFVRIRNNFFVLFNYSIFISGFVRSFTDCIFEIIYMDMNANQAQN